MFGHDARSLALPFLGADASADVGEVVGSKNLRAAPMKPPRPKSEEGSRDVIVQGASFAAGGVSQYRQRWACSMAISGVVGLRNLVKIVNALLRVLLGRFHSFDFEALTTVDHRAAPGL